MLLHRIYRKLRVCYQHHSGLFRISIGVPAESQVQELFCSSVKFDHKISLSVVVARISTSEKHLPVQRISYRLILVFHQISQNTTLRLFTFSAKKCVGSWVQIPAREGQFLILLSLRSC